MLFRSTADIAISVLLISLFFITRPQDALDPNCSVTLSHLEHLENAQAPIAQAPDFMVDIYDIQRWSLFECYCSMEEFVECLIHRGPVFFGQSAATCIMQKVHT